MTYPVAYRTSQPPTIEGGEARYLQGELRLVAATIAQVIDMIPKGVTEAPARPQEGMIRRSNSPWRPVAGQATDRWVIYNGTAWEYLA